MNNRRTHLLFLLILTILLWGGAAAAQSPGAVKLAEFKGPVNPVLASYIERSIVDAEAQAAALLIIELDTPGGSVDITKNITQVMTAPAFRW